MAAFLPTRFTVDSSLALPADQYTADVVGSGVYRDADPADRVTLRAGLRQNGSSSMVTLIQDGIIDDYFTSFEPTRITGQVKGRDQMYALLDTQYQMIYRNGPAPAVVAGQSTVPESNGLFSASQIAADIVASVGLTLSWRCPDYLIQDSFSAVGRPIDLLNQLVRPFSLVEARKVDVYLEGTTVVVRQRSLTPVVPSSNTFSVKDLRITSLRMRKFRTPPIGHVSLRGQALPGVGPNFGSGGAVGGAVVIPDGSTFYPITGAASIAIPSGGLPSGSTLTPTGSGGVAIGPHGGTIGSTAAGTGEVLLPGGDPLVVPLRTSGAYSPPGGTGASGT